MIEAGTPGASAGGTGPLAARSRRPRGTGGRRAGGAGGAARSSRFAPGRRAQPAALRALAGERRAPARRRGRPWPRSKPRGRRSADPRGDAPTRGARRSGRRGAGRGVALGAESLADDIDDPQARAKLAHAARGNARRRARGDSISAATLVAPDGVERHATGCCGTGRAGDRGRLPGARRRPRPEVALKVLHAQLAGAAGADARRRFFAEARLRAAWHPGVVAIDDVDEAARLLAMEYVPGGTFRDRVRAHPTGLSPDEREATARSLLTTLAFVHARGIVHGDSQAVEPAAAFPRRAGPRRFRRGRAVPDSHARRRRSRRHTAVPGARAVRRRPRLPQPPISTPLAPSSGNNLRPPPPLPRRPSPRSPPRSPPDAEDRLASHSPEWADLVLTATPLSTNPLAATPDRPRGPA